MKTKQQKQNNGKQLQSTKEKQMGFPHPKFLYATMIGYAICLRPRGRSQGQDYTLDTRLLQMCSGGLDDRMRGPNCIPEGSVPVLQM